MPVYKGISDTHYHFWQALHLRRTTSLYKLMCFDGSRFLLFDASAIILRIASSFKVEIIAIWAGVGLYPHSGPAGKST